MASARKKPRKKKWPDCSPPAGFPDQPVKTGALDFHVRWMSEKEAEAREVYGECRIDTHVISIRRDLEPRKMAMIFAHEVFHAIFYSAFGTEEKGRKEEELVHAFSAGVAMIARDNPQLLKWWVSLLRG